MAENLSCTSYDYAELHKLVRLLDDVYDYNNFEVNYVNDFTYNRTTPHNIIVREVIEEVMQYHAIQRKMIRDRIIRFQIINYRYNHRKKQYHFAFHNDMELYQDMLILLYINQIVSSGALRTKPVRRLLKMLRSKYKINRKGMIRLSISTIIRTFPSISMTFYNYNLICAAYMIQMGYSELVQMPLVMYHEMISYLLPHETSLMEEAACKPPIALLMYLLMHSSYQYYQIYSLIKTNRNLLKPMYKHVMAAYNNSVFPNELKIRLCISWCIMERCNEGLRYTNAVRYGNEQAKTLIALIMQNDLELHEVLSQI